VGVRGRVVASFAASVALLVVSLSISGPPPAAAVAPPGVLTSRYENASRNLRRDCGFSVPLPSDKTQSIWLFCDIQEVTGSTTLRPGTFASIGPTVPGDVPAALSELPSPPQAIGSLPSDRAPELLLPNPTDLACGASPAYATLRATGLAAGPGGTLFLREGTTPVTVTNSQNVLIVTYVEACVDSVGGAVHPKRLGMAAWDPATNQIKARFTVFDPPGTADLQWYETLGSPLFDRVQLGTPTMHAYFFASNCDTLAGVGCSAGRVFLVHVPLTGTSTLHDPANYRYWAKSRAGLQGPTDPKTQLGWTDAAHAESILPAGTGAGPLYAQVNDYRWVARQGQPGYAGRGEGLVLVEMTNVGGGYRIWQADSPTSRWTQRLTGSTGCVLCGPIVGHPDLSTTGQLLATHFRAADREIEAVALGDVPIESALPGATVASNWERANLYDLPRECGWSAPLPPATDPTATPTENLWVFCDMAPIFNSARETIEGLFFAFIGTYKGISTITPERVPTAISDGGATPRPNNNGPAGILNGPGPIPGPMGQNCGADVVGDSKPDSVAIRWAWGVTRAPAAVGPRLMVLPFTDVCFTGTANLKTNTLADIHVKQSGVAIYDAVSGSVVSETIIYNASSPGVGTPSAPFSGSDLDWPLVWSGPVFSGGYLYLFGSECLPYIDPYLGNVAQKCGSGTVDAVRVPQGSITDPAQYKWHTGSAGAGSWNGTPAQATTIVPATSPTRGPVGFGGSIYVGDYTALGKGFLLLEATSWAGTYRVWQAASPDGPWTLVKNEGAVMPGCEADDAGQPRTAAACYNFAGHPELSTANHLLFSHIQPDVTPTDDDETPQYDVEIVDIGTVPNLP